MAAEQLIQLVFSHHERAVARIGDTFVKVDVDPARSARERDHLAELTALPVPKVLWHHAGPPSILALAAMPGTPLAHDGWAAVGSTLRKIHGARVPTATEAGRARAEVQRFPYYLSEYAAWFKTAGVGDVDLVESLTNRAARFFESYEPTIAFVHGDLQPDHVLMVEGAVSGILDWADCDFGDPTTDIAVLTIDHPQHLDDLLGAYGAPVRRDAVWAFWVLRRFGVIHWRNDHDLGIDADLAALPDLASLVPTTQL